MRYAIVTETYPPDVNGVALTVHGLEQGLRERGHAVDVVRPRRTAAQVAEAHELLVRGAALPRYPGLQFGLPATRRLVDAWTRQRPDALYIATEGPLGWSALRAARRLGIPVSTGFHTRFDQYVRDYGAPFLERTALAWMRRFHNAGGATLVPTRELLDLLRRNGFAHAVRLPRAVDTAAFHPAHRDAELRRAWGLDGDALAVLHVGRLAAEKNLGLAVDAFRAIQRRCPDARMVFVGDGPVRAGLQREHPDFVFTGIQCGPALARHFASGDVFLFPSLTDTFGNVVLEAAASGVPTVAFDTGAAREVIAGDRGGRVVPPGDAPAFVAASVALATVSPSAREDLRLDARAQVDALRPARVAADFDLLLQRLAGGGRHGRLAA